jgi:hypothetical protein
MSHNPLWYVLALLVLIFFAYAASKIKELVQTTDADMTPSTSNSWSGLIFILGFLLILGYGTVQLTGGVNNFLIGIVERGDAEHEKRFIEMETTTDPWVRYVLEYEDRGAYLYSLDRRIQVGVPYRYVLQPGENLALPVTLPVNSMIKLVSYRTDSPTEIDLGYTRFGVKRAPSEWQPDTNKSFKRDSFDPDRQLWYRFRNTSAAKKAEIHFLYFHQNMDNIYRDYVTNYRDSASVRELPVKVVHLD